MPRDFKYDVIQLLRCVRERPCIWDKSLESHKDRVERRAAWVEVFAILEPRYEEMTPTEKKTTGDHILSKWTNIRDTFVKSLKTKCGKPKRKYMLYNQLQFLLKVVPEALDIGNSEDADSSTECTDEGITPMKYEENEDEPVQNNYSTRKRRKRASADEVKDIIKIPAKQYDKNENLDFVEIAVGDESDPRVMNEDEAFFASILPSVVRYTEDERLEFRIEVLALMRRIKESREWVIRRN